MIRILYISNEYPPETGLGGIGTYTMYASEGMAALGHSVHVICQSIDAQSSVKKHKGVTIHRIPPVEYTLPKGKLTYPFRMLCYKHIPHSLIRLAWAKSAWDEFTRMSKSDLHFDIIEYPECGAEGYYFSRCKDSATIVRLHTPWEIISTLDRIKEPVLDKKLMSYLEHRSVKKATVITAPSNAVCHLMKGRWGLEKTHVYPNPIDSRAYPERKGDRWIYTGRIERRKGVHILLHAYAQLCTKITPPPLCLVGRPYGMLSEGIDYGEHIQTLISEYNLEDKVEWIKGATHDQVIDHLHMSSVAFFPSLWENYPYTCLEAMACGLAVVTSDCGGYPEMVRNGKTGFLFKTENAVELVSVMQKLISQPSLVKNLGKAARQHIKTDIDSMRICKSMESVYMNAIRKS